MGDRISIQFVNGSEKSVVLFSHWGGIGFRDSAIRYVETLPKGSQTTPLDRREPETVMVDFIRFITKNEEKVDSDLYLGFNETDGDNSDNGHHLIDLKEMV